MASRQHGFRYVDSSWVREILSVANIFWYKKGKKGEAVFYKVHNQMTNLVSSLDTSFEETRCQI